MLIENLDDRLFADMFGVPSLPARCRQVIRAHDFSVARIEGAARIALIDRVLSQVFEAELPVAGPERHARWEQGWGENLQAYVEGDCDPAALTPGYYQRGAQPMRLFGDYYQPRDPLFEAHAMRVVDAWLDATFLADAQEVHEFGCGPGHNIHAFAQAAPGRRHVGYDWARPSQAILTRMAEATGLPVAGRHIDMFSPPADLQLSPGSVALTIGSMEQIGTRFGAFFDFLLRQDVLRTVHVEPIVEMHDETTFIGDLGARYMRKRGLLEGYLTELRRREAAGEVEITHCRTLMGSTFYDGWCLVAWRKR